MPAKSTSPENGWCLRVGLIANHCWQSVTYKWDKCGWVPHVFQPPHHGQQTVSRQAVVSLEAWGVGLGRAGAGVNLGGRSKYSNENFEGWSRKGFYVRSKVNVCACKIKIIVDIITLNKPISVKSVKNTNKRFYFTFTSSCFYALPFFL